MSKIPVHTGKRIVWHPDYAGMVVQYEIDGKWVDWNSFDEGEYPLNDGRTAIAVAFYNQRLHEHW